MNTESQPVGVWEWGGGGGCYGISSTRNSYQVRGGITHLEGSQLVRKAHWPLTPFIRKSVVGICKMT